MLCRAHGRPILACGKCLPRKFWPRDRKQCRCGQLIPKEWLKCGPCQEWETEDWLDGGLSRRKARYAVIRQVNA